MRNLEIIKAFEGTIKKWQNEAACGDTSYTCDMCRYAAEQNNDYTGRCRFCPLFHLEKHWRFGMFVFCTPEYNCWRHSLTRADAKKVLDAVILEAVPFYMGWVWS